MDNKQNSVNEPYFVFYLVYFPSSTNFISFFFFLFFCKCSWLPLWIVIASNYRQSLIFMWNLHQNFPSVYNESIRNHIAISSNWVWIDHTLHFLVVKLCSAAWTFRAFLEPSIQTLIVKVRLALPAGTKCRYHRILFWEFVEAHHTFNFDILTYFDWCILIVSQQLHICFLEKCLGSQGLSKFLGCTVWW